MRSLAASLLILGGWVMPVQSQQIGDLQERLLNPQVEGEHEIGSRKFQSSAVVQQKTFTTSDFTGAKPFQAAPYETKRFLGIKLPWFADKKADSKAFSGSNDQFRTSAWQNATVSDFEGSTFSQVRRATAVENTVYPVQSSDPRGAGVRRYWEAFQDKTDREYSLEEVRELLNKER